MNRTGLSWIFDNLDERYSAAGVDGKDMVLVIVNDRAKVPSIELLRRSSSCENQSSSSLSHAVVGSSSMDANTAPSDCSLSSGSNDYPSPNRAEFNPTPSTTVESPCSVLMIPGSSSPSQSPSVGKKAEHCLELAPPKIKNTATMTKEQDKRHNMYKHGF